MKVTLLQGQSEFKFEMNLSYRVKDVLLDYREGKPTLIFCYSRKCTVTTASVLAKDLGRLGSVEGGQLAELKLRSLVTEHGIGYHHAGLSFDDRRTVGEPVQSWLAVCVDLHQHLGPGREPARTPGGNQGHGTVLGRTVAPVQRVLLAADGGQGG